MAGFYYYLPNENAAALTAPKKWLSARDRHGLADVLVDVREPVQFVASDVVRNGPDGGSGAIIAAKRYDGFEPNGLGYFPDRQVWMKSAGSAWVGHAGLPRPEWLQRTSRIVEGAFWTPDSQGRKWLIPVARRPGVEPIYGANLPTHAEFDDNLRPVWSLVPDAVELWDLSGRIWNTLNTDADGGMSDDEFAVAALKAIAWYYRIGTAEIRAFARGGMPILDRLTIKNFCQSLIHWDVRISGDLSQESKKNEEEPSGSPSLTGLTDETPAGDLAAAN